MQASEIPYVRKSTAIEKLIADNEGNFVLGPPKAPNKSVGAVRETLLAKLEPRIDMYARRLRDLYHREGSYSDDKIFLEPLRMR